MFLFLTYYLKTKQLFFNPYKIAKSHLSLKKVLSASKQWNIEINSSFNIAALPLIIVFSEIVLYKNSYLVQP